MKKEHISQKTDVHEYAEMQSIRDRKCNLSPTYLSMNRMSLDNLFIKQDVAYVFLSAVFYEGTKVPFLSQNDLYKEYEWI